MIKNFLKDLFKKNKGIVIDEVVQGTVIEEVDKGIVIGEVVKDDFDRMFGKLPNHLKILSALEEIGGSGWDGMNFKNQVLKTAGWTQGLDKKFIDDPDLALAVLSKIRLVLMKTTSKNEIIKALNMS